MSKGKILITVIVFTVIIMVLIILLNPSNTYSNLSVTESKWNSIKESRIENNNLILDTPAVSRQVCIPSARQRFSISRRNSGCRSGSPPVKVTPPPLRVK